MMQVAQNETPKIVVLASLVAIVFSVIGWQVWTEMSKRPVINATGPAVTTAAPTVAEAIPASLPLIDVPGSLVAYSFDPFRKVLPEPRFLAAVRQSPVRAPAVLPGGDGTSIPPFSPMQGSAFGLVPSGPELHLNGIVFGESSVAVFSLGDRTVFVHSGEQITEGVRVLEIVESGVKLKRGKAVTFMRVGE